MMEPIKVALESVLKRLGFNERMMEMTLLDHWEEDVGKAIASHTKPRRIKGGRLFVDVDSPVWVHQLTINYKKGLVEKLNQRLGKRVIEDIRFRQGRMD